MSTIVPTNTNYNSRLLFSNVSELKRAYPFLQAFAIGRSVLGRPIPYIKLGNGSHEVFYNASIHANEWITSVLLMKFIEDFCIAYVTDSKIFGHSARQLFNNSSIYLVPMCNPDGVDLVTGVIGPNTSLYNNTKLMANNYPAIPFPNGWKANIRGVDLNLQFPARLGTSKRNQILSRFCQSWST